MTAEPLAFEPRAQQPRFDNCTAVQQQAIEAATFSGEVIPTSPYKAFRARQYRTERPHLDIQHGSGCTRHQTMVWSRRYMNGWHPY